MIAAKQNIFSSKFMVDTFVGVFDLRCVHISVKLGVFLFPDCIVTISAMPKQTYGPTFYGHILHV